MVLIQDLAAKKRKLFLSLVKKRVQPGTGSSSAFLHQRTWTYSVTNLNLIIKRMSEKCSDGVLARLEYGQD